MRQPIRPDAGLTLVELMVTMIVASLVASSTYMFFAGQQKVYDTQTKMLNVQQNLWSAMETLVRFTRAAGSAMADCVRPDSDGTGADTGAPPPGTLITPTANSLPNTAPIPDTGLRVFHNTFFATSPNKVGRIPPIWIQDGGTDASDRLRVAFGNGSLGGYADAPLAADVANAGSVVKLPATTPETSDIFRINDFIVLMDTSPTPVNLERGCTLMQVTGIDTANDLLAHNPTSPWNPPTSLIDLGTVRYIPFTYVGAPNRGAVRHFGQLNWIEFRIDNGGATPRLIMDRYDGGVTGQVLAEGVEDLQVSFACDGLVGGNLRDGALFEGPVGSRTTDEWIYNGPGEVPPAGCGRPNAIRITLVVRSTSGDDLLNDTALGNGRPAVENRVAGAVDTFRHRVQETVIFPRN